MTLTNTRLSGHALLEKGAALVWDIELESWVQKLGDDFNLGVGVCTCGSTSEVLNSSRGRREWHRRHKQDVLTEQSMSALKTAYPDDAWDEPEEDVVPVNIDVTWEAVFFPERKLVRTDEQQDAVLTAIADAIHSPNSWIAVKWGDVSLVMSTPIDRTRVIFAVDAVRTREDFQDDVAALLASLGLEGDLYVNRVLTIAKEP